MKRFELKMVFSGLVTAWRLAICPTRTSPFSSHATTLGVVRDPSSLTITLGSRPSMIATTLLVVPRSIPMILPMLGALPRFYARATDPNGSGWRRELSFSCADRVILLENPSVHGDRSDAKGT